MVSRVIPVRAFDLVIFGGTGDLARRKILPGLYRRFCDGQIPRDACVIGVARAGLDDARYHAVVREALSENVAERKCTPETLAAFLRCIRYVSLDATGSKGWKQLASLVRADALQAFYFSVDPDLFGGIAKRLHKHRIAGPQARIVVEKPFGNDLASARELNRTLAKHFSEEQIYRIDHYLGKETVQNLMAVRFANMLFEPLWNAQHVDHIQITVAETVGVEGRGEYYDGAGAMRDMIQNHLMQLLCLTAMEPPSKFGPDAVRDEKLKVIRALDPVEPEDIVRGQYKAGEATASYAEDAGNPASRTESFIALRLHISNWRWNGTDFYLRTGKRMAARTSEIVVQFKDPPHAIFGEDAGQRANELSIRLQPNEGMDLTVTIKEPGPGGMRLMNVPLDMTFLEALGEEAAEIPDAYERLIMDVIRGDQTLFMRGDEVEAAWAWTDPVIAAWERRGDVPLPYPAGSSGPDEARILLLQDGRRWRELKR
jgi:glucose-6-phosphate 1-dehydrogenase